jgi:GT2 family glycosyltransferase
MQQSEKIAIVIVNWNGWRDTVVCLESVLRLENIDDCLIVVIDNGSTDGSREKIAAWAGDENGLDQYILTSLPVKLDGESKTVSFHSFTADDLRNGNVRLEQGITLIESGSNLGFAGANNIGIELALKRTEITHIWLLNPDTVVESKALTCLLEKYSRDGQPEMIGSTLVQFSDPSEIQAQGGGRWNMETMSTEHIGSGLKIEDGLDEQTVESQMDYVVGASLLVDRRFIERVGPMDASLFLYFEELDWVLRAQPTANLGYARDSIVYHKEGASTGLNSQTALSGRSFYFFNRNRYRIVEQYWPEKLSKLKRQMAWEIAVYVKRRQFDRSRILGYVLAGKELPEISDSPDNKK